MKPDPTAMIGAVAGYLAKTLKAHKSVKDFFSDFTEATVNWIRPIFLTDDDKPKEVLQKLIEKPDSAAKQDAVKAAIASDLEDRPGAEALLREMFDIIQSKAARGEAISITASKNVVTGNIKAGGNVQVGDINTTNNPK